MSSKGTLPAKEASAERCWGILILWAQDSLGGHAHEHPAEIVTAPFPLAAKIVLILHLAGALNDSALLSDILQSNKQEVQKHY